MAMITDKWLREYVQSRGQNPDDPQVIERLQRRGFDIGEQPDTGIRGDLLAVGQGTWRGLLNSLKGVANLPTAIGAFVGVNENPEWWKYTEPTWNEKANPWAAGAGSAIGFIGPLVATGGMSGAGGLAARGLGAAARYVPIAGRAAKALEVMAQGSRAARLVPQALEAATFAGLTTPGTVEERAASALQMGVFGAAQGALGAPLHLGRLKTAAWEGAVGALAGGLTGSPVENVPGVYGGGAMGAVLGFLTGGKAPKLVDIDAARKAGADTTSTPFVRPKREVNPLAPVRQAQPLTERQQYEIEAPQVGGKEARLKLVGLARQEARDIVDALSEVDHAPPDAIDRALDQGVDPREISAGVVETETPTPPPPPTPYVPRMSQVPTPEVTLPAGPYDPFATNAAVANALGVDTTLPAIPKVTTEVSGTTPFPNAPRTDLSVRPKPISSEPVTPDVPIPPPTNPAHPALVIQELNVFHAMTEGGIKGRMERIKAWAKKNFGRDLSDADARRYATTVNTSDILNEFPVSGLDALKISAAEGAQTRGTKLVDPRKRTAAAAAERAGKLEQAGKGSDTYFEAEAAANRNGTTYAAIVHARGVWERQNPRTRGYGTVAEEMRREGWNVNVARKAAQIVTGEAPASRTYDALNQLPEIVQKFVAEPVKKKLAEVREAETKAREAAQAKLAKATEQRARSIERQTKVLSGIHNEIDLQNPRFEKIKDRLARMEERLSSGKPVKEPELQAIQRTISAAKKTLAAEAKAESARVAAAAKKSQAKLASTHLPKIREAQVAAGNLLRRLPTALKRLEEAQVKWASVKDTGDYRTLESAGKRLAEAAQEVRKIQDGLTSSGRDLAKRQADAAAENVLLNQRLADAQVDLDGQMYEALNKLDNLDLQTASTEGARALTSKMADDLGQNAIPGGMADAVLGEDSLFAHMVGYLGNLQNTYIAKAQAGLKWFAERKVIKENPESWPATRALAAEGHTASTPFTLAEWLDTNDKNAVLHIQDNQFVLEFKDTGQSYFFDNPQQAAIFYDRAMQRRIVEPEMGPEGMNTTLPPDATPRPPKMDPENPESESGGNLPPKPDGGEGPGDPPDIGTPRDSDFDSPDLPPGTPDVDISKLRRWAGNSEQIFRKVDKMWFKATGKELGLSRAVNLLHEGYANFIRQSTQRIDELSGGLQKFGFVNNGRVSRHHDVAFDATMAGIDADVFLRLSKGEDPAALEAELPVIMATHVNRHFRGEERARALQFVQYYDKTMKAVADDAGVPTQDRQVFYYRRTMENSPALTVRSEGVRLETDDWVPGFQKTRMKEDPEAMVDPELMRERVKLGIDPTDRPFTAMVSGYVRGVYRHKNMNIAVGGLQKIVGELSPNLNANLRDWTMQEIRRARGMQLEAEANGSRSRALRMLKMAQALKGAHEWLSGHTSGPLTTGLTKNLLSRLEDTYVGMGFNATEGHVRSWLDGWVQLHRSSIFGYSLMRPVRDLVTTDMFLMAPRFDLKTMAHVFKTINPLNPDYRNHIERFIQAGVLQRESILSDTTLSAPKHGRRFWEWVDKPTRGYTSLDQKMRAQSVAAAEYTVERAMKRYAKTGRFGDFIESASLDTFGSISDRNVMAELEARVKRGDKEGAWKMVSNIYQDGINFNYSLVNKPGYLDKAIGRFLGQYGTWPVSAINSMIWMMKAPSELAKQGIYTKQQARKRTLAIGAKYALAAEAVYSVGAMFGIDTGDWIPFVHSVYYTGGPGLSIGAEAFDIVRGDPQIMARFKKEPWMTTANYARRFIPLPASDAIRRSMSQTESIGDYPTLQRVLGLPQFQKEWGEQMAVRMGFFPWERPLKKTITQNLATLGVGNVMAPIQDTLSEGIPILAPGSREKRTGWGG